MIQITETYEIISDESAKNGDVEDSGFVCPDYAVSFRELVALMENYPNPSCGLVGGYTWFTSEEDRDFSTGNYKTTSIHFSRKNPERVRKYWIKAAKVAGYKAA